MLENTIGIMKFILKYSGVLSHSETTVKTERGGINSGKNNFKLTCNSTKTYLE